MKIRLFVFAASALIAQSVAHAGIVTISGSGTWGPDAPISIYTAPGESWSFSFELPSPLDATFTSTATNFQYFLNGTAVNTTLSSVEFFDQAQGACSTSISPTATPSICTATRSFQAPACPSSQASTP